MTNRINADPRIDPRIKVVFQLPDPPALKDVASREALLEEVNRPEAPQAEQATEMFLNMCDNETTAPSAGLKITTQEFVSAPDGNTIKLQIIRPDTAETLPCIYYIHGGGMQVFSCFNGMYRAWGRIIAARGVAVVMVDFRNALRPSSAPDVAPFPAPHHLC